MKNPRGKRSIPLFDLSLSAKARKEVASTLASGWLTTGPKVATFERAICRHLNVKYAAAVNSGTAGLYLTLKAIGAGKGRQVVTTPFTFIATVEAILMAGATPVFADIVPHTLNIDPEEVARKVSDRTVAIIPADIAGYPANYELLNKVADERSLYLVADAAHSFSTTYQSKTIPNITDAAVFSFYSTKNLTCGEGGMVLSKHKQLIDKVKCLSLHGLTSSAFERKLTNKWEYDVVDFGFKANMSDIHAAVGLGQLTTFKKDQTKRIALTKRYIKNLTGLSDFLELPIIEKHYRHGWYLFIIKLHLSHLRINRDRFIKLMANFGIECGVHYKPVFELTYYRDLLGLSEQYFPNAAYAGHRVVTLPLYPSLKVSDVDYVCDCISAIVTKHSR
jgi:dTDP-4-amino-4,6-dideoxygalactose transaminase